MRVGLMLVAAAALVTGASGAEAQSFYRYDAIAYGYTVSLDSSYNEKSRSYSFYDISFALPVTGPAPIVTADIYSCSAVGYCTGIGPTAGNLMVDGTVSGKISANNSFYYPGGTNVSALSVNYPSAAGASGLPTTFGQYAATGGFSNNFQAANSNIYQYTVATISAFNVSSSATAQTLLFSAVPETATWLMMILGFGAAGYALRRRPVMLPSRP